MRNLVWYHTPITSTAAAHIYICKQQVGIPYRACLGLSIFWIFDRSRSCPETTVWTCTARPWCSRRPTSRSACCNWSNATTPRGPDTIGWTRSRCTGGATESPWPNQNRRFWQARDRSTVSSPASCPGGRNRACAWTPILAISLNKITRAKWNIYYIIRYYNRYT